MRGLVYDGKQLQLTDALRVRAPGPGEALVRVHRSGVCHSDLNVMKGGMIGTPVVLGHEAAGEVVAVGDSVERVARGDRVMVGTQTSCGHCRECARDTPANCDATWGMSPDQPFIWEGRPVYSFSNVSSFAGEIVVKDSQLYPIGDLPFEQAALIGCAVSTGYGAARVLGGVRAGDRVAVLGIGGIGVNAIAAAHLAGAEVLAVDRLAHKEATARHFGADDFLAVEPGMDGDALTDAMRARFAPIDVAIECSGATVAVAAAIGSVKRGGRAVLIGISAPGSAVPLALDHFVMGREVVAALNGGARPERDYPALISLARNGALDLSAQVSGVWPLARFEEAIAALEGGEVTRAVLDHNA